MLSRILTAEHFKQDGGDSLRGDKRDRSEFPYQSLPVDGAQLVKCGLSGFSLKAQWNPRGIGARRSGHGDNDDGLQILVHFIGRDHQALFYLGPVSGIKRHQPDLVLCAECGSPLPLFDVKLVGGGREQEFIIHTRRGTTKFFGPAFTGYTGRRNDQGFVFTRKSTASPKPSCSIIRDAYTPRVSDRPSQFS
jgi:hypothetical protein